MKKAVLVLVVVFSMVFISCDPETLYGEDLSQEDLVTSTYLEEHGQLPSEPDDDEE